MSAPGQRQSPFQIVMRGYDRDQVTDHIRQLEADLAMMAADRDSAHAHSDELLAHLDAARAQLHAMKNEVEALSAPPTTVTGMSERLSRMLSLATEEAAEIRSAARDEAAEVVSVARQEADRLRSDAEADAARTMELAQEQSDKLITDAEARADVVDAAAAETREFSQRDRAEAQRDIADRLAEAQERAAAIIAAAEADASGLRGAAHHVATARLARSRDLAAAAHTAHRQILDHLDALRDHIGALPGALELSEDEQALVGASETGDLDLLNRTLVGRDRFEAESADSADDEAPLLETTDVLDAIAGEYTEEVDLIAAFDFTDEPAPKASKAS